MKTSGKGDTCRPCPTHMLILLLQGCGISRLSVLEFEVVYFFFSLLDGVKETGSLSAHKGCLDQTAASPPGQEENQRHPKPWCKEVHLPLGWVEKEQGRASQSAGLKRSTGLYVIHLFIITNWLISGLRLHFLCPAGGWLVPGHQVSLPTYLKKEAGLLILPVVGPGQAWGQGRLRHWPLG